VLLFDDARQKLLVLVMCGLTLAQVALIVPVKASLPNKHINPVPYYGQGSNPWCAVAVAAMIIAYAKYPEETPTLTSLAKEMGTGEGGTGLGEFLGAMHNRGIEIATTVSYDSYHIRYCLDSGYPVVAVTKHRIEKEGEWEWVDIRITALHAMLTVGYEGEKILVHDPATAPLVEYSDKSIQEAWAYGYVVKTRPRETPCYIVRVNILGAVSPVQLVLDSETQVNSEFKFEIGTTHRFEVLPTTTRYENETHRITSTCRNSVVTLRQWVTGLRTLQIIYSRNVECRVRVAHPTGLQDLWVDYGDRLTVQPVDSQLPADDVLGLLGFKKVFRGWYDDERLLSRSVDLGFVVTGPLKVIPRWELEVREGPAIWVLGIICASGIVTAIFGRYFILTRKRAP
jgi:hypothetical protein